MSKLILLSLLLIVSCSTSPIDKNTRFDNIDSRLIPYVKIFEKHYRQHIPNGTTMVLENIESQNAGGYYNRLEDITHINLRRWLRSSKQFKLMVVMHELGHHILKRDHIDNWNFKDGCPDSLMFWSIREFCFTKYKNHYTIELFMPYMEKFYPYNHK